MKTIISLPHALFTEAEKVADELGVSRSHLYALALAEYLCANTETVERRLSRLHKRPVRSLDLALQIAACRTLQRAEWQ